VTNSSMTLRSTSGAIWSGAILMPGFGSNAARSSG
jgi:hypothetical protein